MSSLDEVEAICAKVGGLQPDPSVSEWDWGFWLAGFQGFPERLPCPRCGGHLVEKYGKRGKFVGCSNYPACRYTA